MASDKTPLKVREIAQRIHLVRGYRVILDSDLVAFYGESTKRFNQQVSRNLARFPPNFMFQLDTDEDAALRLQIETSNNSAAPGRGGRRSRARVFTEHGAIMSWATLPHRAIPHYSPSLLLPSARLG